MIESLKFNFFVFTGSIIEEIFPPLPSPLFIVIAKIAKSAQSYSLPYLLFISLIAALGKTVGAVLLYVLGNKGENIIISHFGKFLNISHADVENIGARLKKGIRDVIILLIFRIIPIIPTTPVSFVCGIIKIDFYTFLITTFFGFFVRIMIIFYIGSKTFSLIKSNMDNTFYITIFFIHLFLVSIICWRYFKRKK